jgi:valyl-tRNA synthetase
VPPGRKVHAVIAVTSTPALYESEASLIGRLARATLTIGGRVDGPAMHALLPDGSDLVLSLGGLVDIEQERRKLAMELEQLEKQLGALRGRLSNDAFTARAPAHIVEGERSKEHEWATRVDGLRKKLHSLGAAA